VNNSQSKLAGQSEQKTNNEMNQSKLAAVIDNRDETLFSMVFALIHWFIDLVTSRVTILKKFCRMENFRANVKM